MKSEHVNESNSPKRIALVAGKSGGHIVPGMTYVTKMLQGKPGTDFTVFTTKSPLDTKIIKNYEGQYSRHITLSFGELPYGRLYKLPIAAWLGFVSLLHSLRILYKTKPELVVSMAGVVSLPVCLAAWILRIPVELFELNAVPGKATRVLKYSASKVNVCFSDARKHFSNNVRLVDYPVRFSLNDLEYDQAKVRESLGLDPSKETILLLGGSQGSRTLNWMMIDWASGLTPSEREGMQIIHQAGNHDPVALEKRYSELGLQAYVFGHRHNLVPCYQAADRVVCRAGAGTLFEILFFGKQCLMVPLRAKTTSHQVDNANAMQRDYSELFSVHELN
jgi:UDP-N-acetylglucosamine--N-acetylmuramyl-(pentapeptide) pyrophosphoryl-undecaprenol N-acetylglucosamine transferase